VRSGAAVHTSVSSRPLDREDPASRRECLLTVVHVASQQLLDFARSFSLPGFPPPRAHHTFSQHNGRRSHRRWRICICRLRRKRPYTSSLGLSLARSSSISSAAQQSTITYRSYISRSSATPNQRMYMWGVGGPLRFHRGRPRPRDTRSDLGEWSPGNGFSRPTQTRQPNPQGSRRGPRAQPRQEASHAGTGRPRDYGA
jgi:hypothetical protein